MTILARLAALDRRRWLLLLIATALVTRFAWAVALSSRAPRFDERAYIAHAIRLAEGKGYVDGNGQPTAFWPVVYPAVLGAFYALAGQSPLTGVLLQGILGIAVCLLISFVGTAAFGPRVGRPAALLLAIYPTHVFYTTLHLTEPLFTLLLVTAVALLLKSLVRGTAAAAAGGLALGLAALTRPAILLLPLALPVWYWLQGRRRSTALALAVVVGCGTLAAVSPWLVRNHAVTGSWTTISTTGGYNFWMGNHPGAFGGYGMRKEINERLRDSTGYDYSRGYRLGLAHIAASPLRTAIRALRKVSYFFALETDGVLWNLKGLAQRPPMPVTLVLLGVANAAYVVVLAFAVLGLMGTPREHPLASLFLLLTGYLVLVTAVFIGDPRYHYALMPFAAVFSAKGFVEDWPVLTEAVKTKRPGARRRLLTWVAIIVVFVILIAANVVLKTLEFSALGR